MYNRCTLVEFRGVWIASVYNIDWPKTLDNTEAQKQEFIEILDKLDSDEEYVDAFDNIVYFDELGVENDTELEELTEEIYPGIRKMKK